MAVFKKYGNKWYFRFKIRGKQALDEIEEYVTKQFCDNCEEIGSTELMSHCEFCEYNEILDIINKAKE